MKRVFSSQVSVFQRGGSVVCRSTGSGSCTAEQQQLPLSITVALNSEVSIKGFQVGKLNTGDFLTNSDTEQCHSMSCIKVFVNGWHFRDVVERAAYEMCIYTYFTVRRVCTPSPWWRNARPTWVRIIPTFICIRNQNICKRNQMFLFIVLLSSEGAVQIFSPENLSATSVRYRVK